MSNSIQTIKALVVDDEAIVRLVHTSILTKIGYEVMQAENGEDAVALAEKNIFDLILMDINMPKMNGLEATIKIRERENAHCGPIIIGITGVEESEHASFLRAGMNKVLGKPISTNTLLEVIQRVKKVKQKEEIKI